MESPFRALFRPTDLEELAEILQRRDRWRPRARVDAPGFGARVLRLSADAPPRVWDPSPARKIVFFLGDDAFSRLMESSNDHEFLLSLGYSREFIRAEVAANKRFELTMFRADHQAALPATWENLATLVGQQYGPDIHERVLKALPELQATRDFREFEALAGHPLSVASRVDDTCHVTLERLRAMPLAEVEAWQVRFFLALACNVNPLFSGCGRTRTETDDRPLNELIGPNGPISDIGPWKTLTLRVDS
jgi:hypothetical protein